MLWIDVTVLELSIVPDTSGGEAHASLPKMRLARYDDCIHQPDSRVQRFIRRVRYPQL
jgi:hypothetical protein